MTGGLGPLAKWRITRGGAAPTIRLAAEIQIHFYVETQNSDPLFHLNTKSKANKMPTPDYKSETYCTETLVDLTPRHL